METLHFETDYNSENQEVQPLEGWQVFDLSIEDNSVEEPGSISEAMRPEEEPKEPIGRLDDETGKIMIGDDEFGMGTSDPIWTELINDLGEVMQSGEAGTLEVEFQDSVGVFETDGLGNLLSMELVPKEQEEINDEEIIDTPQVEIEAPLEINYQSVSIPEVTTPFELDFNQDSLLSLQSVGIGIFESPAAAQAPKEKLAYITAKINHEITLQKLSADKKVQSRYDFLTEQIPTKKAESKNTGAVEQSDEDVLTEVLIQAIKTPARELPDTAFNQKVSAIDKVGGVEEYKAPAQVETTESKPKQEALITEQNQNTVSLSAEDQHSTAVEVSTEPTLIEDTSHAENNQQSNEKLLALQAHEEIETLETTRYYKRDLATAKTQTIVFIDQKGKYETSNVQINKQIEPKDTLMSKNAIDSTTILNPVKFELKDEPIISEPKAKSPTQKPLEYKTILSANQTKSSEQTIKVVEKPDVSGEIARTNELSLDLHKEEKNIAISATKPDSLRHIATILYAQGQPNKQSQSGLATEKANTPSRVPLYLATIGPTRVSNQPRARMEPNLQNISELLKRTPPQVTISDEDTYLPVAKAANRSLAI